MKQVNEPVDVAGRVRPVNDRPVDYNGDYVLHWMTSARRAEYNHALDRSAA